MVARGLAAAKDFLVWTLRDRWGVDIDPQSLTAVCSKSQANSNIVPFAPPLPPEEAVTKEGFLTQVHRFVAVVKDGAHLITPRDPDSEARWVSCGFSKGPHECVGGDPVFYHRMDGTGTADILTSSFDRLWTI